MTIEQAEQFEEQELYDKAYAEYKKLLEKDQIVLNFYKELRMSQKFLGWLKMLKNISQKLLKKTKQMLWLMNN